MPQQSFLLACYHWSLLKPQNIWLTLISCPKVKHAWGWAVRLFQDEKKWLCGDRGTRGRLCMRQQSTELWKRRNTARCGSWLTQTCRRPSDDFTLLLWVGKLESDKNAEVILPFFFQTVQTRQSTLPGAVGFTFISVCGSHSQHQHASSFTQMWEKLGGELPL